MVNGNWELVYEKAACNEDDLSQLFGENVKDELDLTAQQAERLEDLIPGPLSTKNMSTDERKEWDKIKQELNYWGDIFSRDNVKRPIAAEKIIKIFHDNTEYYQTESANRTGPERSYYDKKYQKALRLLNKDFPYCQDHPVRFLKHVYPQGLFMNVISTTLGIGLLKDGSISSRCFDHTKGAKYVTYFNTVLRSMERSYKRDTYRENHLLDTQVNNQLEQEDLSVPDDFTNLSSDREYLTLFASLTYDALKYKLHMPNPTKKYSTDVNVDILQLYYTFRLVNYSRDDTVITPNWDKVLMDAAEAGFLIFSTTLKETNSYPALQLAELSNKVISNNLYKKINGVAFLLDKSVAHYREVGQNTISKQFSDIRDRLKPLFSN